MILLYPQPESGLDLVFSFNVIKIIINTKWTMTDYEEN